MPFCPECQQEYDAGFAQCADCLVPLVANLSDPQAAEGPPPELEAMAIRAENEEVLDLMIRAVAIHHIPIRTSKDIPELKGKGSFLVIPAMMGAKVIKILDHGVPDLIGEGEGEERYYRFYQQGKEGEIRNPPILQQSTDALIERGAEVLEELIEIVAKGDDAARGRAAYVLACMGDMGVEALFKLLKVAIEKEEDSVCISLIRVMRAELEVADRWQEISEFLKATKISKILTLHALAALNACQAFPSILPLLDDDDPAVRDEADNTLCTLTDEDMGFVTEDPRPDRQKIMEKWQTWWEVNQNG